MNKKQLGTFRSIFAEPVRANIAWSDVESLLLALGATMKQGKGSMVGFVLNDVKAVLHRPHPGKELS